MAVKIANRDARQHVQRNHPFQGSNLYGMYWCANPSSIDPGDSGYAVFSYGQHFPLFICTVVVPHGPDVWFENKDRYSVTTSKHRSQSHPHQPTQPLSTADMHLLLRKGYRALVAQRLGVHAYQQAQTEFHMEVA